MSNFFRRKPQVNNPELPAAGARIQSAALGQPIPVGYGHSRISGNLIWFNGGNAYSVVAQGSSSGKGGSVGGGGKSASQQSNTTYTYSAGFVMALCEGPASLQAPSLIWYSKNAEDFVTAENPGNVYGNSGALGLVYINGSAGNGVLPYIATNYPTTALAYRNTAYIAATPMFLGTATDIPQISVAIFFAIHTTLPGAIEPSTGEQIYDAGFPLIINDILTNAIYGLEYPVAHLDTAMTLFTNYTYAMTLLHSPVLSDQRPMTDYMAEWMEAANSNVIFSSGKMRFIPYGDTAVAANGYTYTPPSYTGHIISDFIDTGNDEDIVVKRKQQIDVYNTVTIEYLDYRPPSSAIPVFSASDLYMQYYNAAIVEAKDDSLIDLFEPNPMPTKRMHGFTYPKGANQVAQLLLNRQLILNTFTFTVGPQYILLDPMDIIQVTNAVLGLQSYPVRIVEITENDDYSLTIVAEDFLAGVAHSPAFATEPRTGIAINFNAAPGNVSAPMIFEPTYQQAGGLFVYIAVAGLDMTRWGGCDIFVSTDGINYSPFVTLQGPSRYGVTTTALATLNRSTAVQGNSVDNLNTLGVDLTISQASLPSSTQSDMLAFSSLLYMDGEFIAYQNSTPTSTYDFNLTTLNRGGFGTNFATHASGVSICRVDDNLAKGEYSQALIGSTVYFKFLSFNQYGGARQELSDVGAYSYTIQGTAFTGNVQNSVSSQYNPSNYAGNVQFTLPVVQNFTANYIGGSIYLDWDSVIDPRWPINYQIRKGSSWELGTIVGTYAHTHIPAPGNDTYWIKAVCYSPASAPGAIFYSSAPTSLVVTSALLPAGLNLLATFVEDTGGVSNFTGFLDNSITKPVTALRTVAAGIPVVLLHFDDLT